MHVLFSVVNKHCQIYREIDVHIYGSISMVNADQLRGSVALHFDTWMFLAADIGLFDSIFMIVLLVLSDNTGQ